MKSIIITIFLLGYTIYFTVLGQERNDLQISWEECTNCGNNYPTYNNTDDLTSWDIVSDYGRRETNSRWHAGIDISPRGGSGEAGFHIISPVSGTIREIFRMSYKVLVIDGPGNNDYGFGHIFEDELNYPFRSGDMVIAHLTSDTDYGAIIYDPQNSEDGYCLTDAPLPPGNSHYMTYTRPDGTVVTYSVANGNLRNTVNEGDIIAPIGGSGGFANAAHIHLYNYIDYDVNVVDFQKANNQRNPLNFLDYNQPTLTNTIQGITIANGANPVAGPYYDNIDIKARVSFNALRDPAGRWTEASPILDIDNVSIQIKSEFESDVDYRLLKGADFRSKVDYGGRWTNPGRTRYPSYNNPVGNTIGGDNSTAGNSNRSTGVDIAQRKEDVAVSAGYGNYRKMGIYSRAYSDFAANHNYDEYFFNDYHTRIHRDDNFGKASVTLALRNEDARYPDGRYDLIAESQTTRDVDFDNSATPTRITIDNFKPYIKEVFIVSDQSEFGYEREWNWNSTTNNQILGPDQSDGFIYENDGFDISVTTSEPMQSMTISIPSLGISDQPMENVFPTAPIEEAGRAWAFNVTSAQSVAGDHLIIFTGQDLATNTLVEVPTSIPYHNAAGGWTNDRPDDNGDQNHTFTIEAGGCRAPGGGRVASCLQADFTFTVDPSNTLNYQFNDASSPASDVTSWSWNFGDPASGGANTSNLENPLHAFSAPGIYTVELTVGDGSITSSISKNITVSESPAVVVSFTASPGSGNAQLTVQLNGSTNLVGVSGYEWLITPSTGFTYVSGTRNSISARVRFDDPNTYQVRFRVTDGSNSYFSDIQDVEVRNENAPEPDFSWDNPVYVDQATRFTDESQYGCFLEGDPYYEWEITGGPSAIFDRRSGFNYGDLIYNFAQIGQYQVRLCITDGCGDKVCSPSKNVNVTQFVNTVFPDFIASDVNIKRRQSIRFTDITSDPQNKIVHWGWYFERTPGTSLGVCDVCLERDEYVSYVDHQYNTPGTFEATLNIHENLGFEGRSKSITINVEDNVIHEDFEKFNNFQTRVLDSYGNRVIFQGTDGKFWIYKKNGNTWGLEAKLGTSPVLSFPEKVRMHDNKVVVLKDDKLYYFFRVGGSWVDRTEQDEILINGGEIFDFDISSSTLAVSSEQNLGALTGVLSIYTTNDVSTSGTGDRAWFHVYDHNLNTSIGDDYKVAAHDETVAISTGLQSSPVRYQVKIFDQNFSGNWAHVATLESTNNSFGNALDISDNAVVVTTKSGGTTRGHLFQKPTSGWSGVITSETTTLNIENPSNGAVAWDDEVRIDGDNVVMSGNRGYVTLFQKPLNGWGSASSLLETARFELNSGTFNRWGYNVIFGFHNNNVVISNGFSTGSFNKSLYFFEVEPTLCDDSEILDGFNIVNGASISNSKGVLTIGGGAGGAIINNGGTGDFRGTSITIKNGFHARAGSMVEIVATNCDDF